MFVYIDNLNKLHCSWDKLSYLNIFGKEQDWSIRKRRLINNGFSFKENFFNVYAKK